MHCAVPALLVLVSAVVPACGSSSSPAAPDTGVGNATGAVTITGSERLGWSQPATSAGEAAAFGYRLSVDGSRVDLTGTTCEPSAIPGLHDCSAPLPRLAPGRHVLSLLAVDSRGVEGPPSLTLTVFLSGS